MSERSAHFGQPDFCRTDIFDHLNNMGIEVSWFALEQALDQIEKPSRGMKRIRTQVGQF